MVSAFLEVKNECLSGQDEFHSLCPVALCSLVVSAEGFNCSCWEVMESLLNLGRNCLIGLARTPIHREQTRNCGNRVVRHGGGYKVQMLEWNNQNPRAEESFETELILIHWPSLCTLTWLCVNHFLSKITAILYILAYKLLNIQINIVKKQSASRQLRIVVKAWKHAMWDNYTSSIINLDILLWRISL